MKNFEENLARLESLTSDIKRTDISLEDALKDFEEGIKLTRGLEEELNKIEGKVNMLMTEPSSLDENNPPEMDTFSDFDRPVNGTRA